MTSKLRVYRVGNRHLRDDGPVDGKPWSRVIDIADHEAAIAEEAEATDQWRKLAHQFDKQRMDALAMLKRVAASPILAADCAAFVAAAPECGESIIAAHEAARAADKARIAALEEVARETLAVIERLRPDGNGMGTIVRLKAALAQQGKEGEA